MDAKAVVIAVVLAAVFVYLMIETVARKRREYENTNKLLDGVFRQVPIRADLSSDLISAVQADPLKWNLVIFFNETDTARRIVMNVMEADGRMTIDHLTSGVAAEINRERGRIPPESAIRKVAEIVCGAKLMERRSDGRYYMLPAGQELGDILKELRR